MSTTYIVGPIPCTGTDPGTATHPFSGRVVLVGTTDTANNQTSLQWRFEIYINNDMYISRYDYGSGVTVTVSINGDTVFSNTNYGNTVQRIQMNNHYLSSGSGPLVLCSGTKVVKHDEDGKKTVAVSASIKVAASGNYLGTIAPSGNVVLEPITRIGAISSAPDMSLIGYGTTNHTVSWTSASGFYYKVQYLYRTTVLHTSSALATSATSYTWAVPVSVAENVTNAQSMTAQVVVHTYTDSACTNEIGTSSRNFTINFGSGFGPSIIHAYAVWNNTMDIYAVSGLSYPELEWETIYTANATFKSGFAVYVDANGNEVGQRVTSETLPIDLPPISPFPDTTKTYSVKISETDSRGFTTTDTISQTTVYGWTAPSITSISAYRCDSNGTASMAGGYYMVTFTYSIRPIQNENGKSATVSYKYASGSTWTQSSSGALSAYSGTLTLGPYTLSAAQDEKLEVRVALSDTMSASSPTTVSTTVPAPSVFIDILTSGEDKVGLGIGMVAGSQHTIQTTWNWKQYDDNDVLRVSLDFTNGLVFYDSSGTVIGSYPVTGGGGGGGGGAYNILSTNNGDGTQNLTITDA